MTQTISKLAKQLEPHIVRIVRKTASGQMAVRGRGGIGGPTQLHRLNDPNVHSGTLADDQAPQFLKRDGSRSLTGNLIVDPGVLIDSVDIDVHVADPDAHHPRARSSPTISVGAFQTISLVRRQDSGLTADGGAGVGAGYGLRTQGDFTHIRLDENPALAVSAVGLRLGTPGKLAWNTLSERVGEQHFHAIESEFDVGTTPKAALLRSTSQGGLTLRSLDAKGEVNVGQSLFAGNNALRVIYHAADSLNPVDHVHLVVNPTGSWTLDEQFGVDIDDNLLVRGWIVGRHAIQIADAEIILHFDGPEPYERNFVGEMVGHMGQVPDDTFAFHGGIFRPGKFGKGVQQGEATTNLVTNPSFESGSVGVSGWTNYATGTAGGFRYRTVGGKYGNMSYILDKTEGDHTDRWGVYTIFTAEGGKQHTASIWYWAESLTAEIWMEIWSTGVSGTPIARGTGGAGKGWQRLTLTWNQNTTANTYLYIYITNGMRGTRFDAVQVEAKPYATPYCDGSLGSGHAWTGEPHNSVSTRSAHALKYNFVNLPNPWTWMGWITPERINGAGEANPAIPLSIDVGGTGNDIEVNFVPNEFEYDGNPIHVTLVYSGRPVGGKYYLDVYTNGELVDSIDVGAAFAGGVESFVLGDKANPRGGYVWDDVILVRRALPENEIRAIYDSDAPVFAETSTFQWRAGRNRFWADSEGMWMLAAGGNRMFGAYAGNDLNPSELKNWGGYNLGEGDILFGQYGLNKGGWLLFDQDWEAGEPGLSFGYGDKNVLRVSKSGAFLDGVLGLSQGGGIYQGTGTFASPTTGLRMRNESNVGVLEGYNAGELQWKASTDGRLYAGYEGTTPWVRIHRKGVEVLNATRQSSIPLAVGNEVDYDPKGAYKLTNNTGDILGALYAANFVNSKTWDVVLFSQSLVSTDAARMIVAASRKNQTFNDTDLLQPRLELATPSGTSPKTRARLQANEITVRSYESILLAAGIIPYAGIELDFDGTMQLNAEMGIMLNAVSNKVQINGPLEVGGNYRIGTTWTTMTFSSGWGLSDATRPPQYKRLGNMIFLRGIVKRTTPGASQSIATGLPAPSQNQVFPATSGRPGVDTGQIYVTTSGVLVYGSGADPDDRIFLDGIIYHTN